MIQCSGIDRDRGGSTDPSIIGPHGDRIATFASRDRCIRGERSVATVKLVPPSVNSLRSGDVQGN